MEMAGETPGWKALCLNASPSLNGYGWSLYRAKGAAITQWLIFVQMLTVWYDRIELNEKLPCIVESACGSAVCTTDSSDVRDAGDRRSVEQADECR